MADLMRPSVCTPEVESPTQCRQMLSSYGFVPETTVACQQIEAKIPSYQLRGNSECGCPTCHRVFSSERAFDLHRVGDYAEARKCAENLASVGLELDSRGRWRAVR